MRRRALSGLAALTFAAAVAGCGERPRDDPSRTAAPRGATVAVDSLPVTLDPARATSVAERAVAVAVYTPLLSYRRRADASAGTLVAALARDLPTLSADQRAYTFRLRPGLLYSDGRLVKASDVERSIAHASQVAADPALKAVLGGIVGAPSTDGNSLAGVVSDDRSGQLTVRLRAPDGRLPLALAEPATAPLPELPPARADDELPAATGPLRIARRSATALDLVANPLRAPLAQVPAAGLAQITLTARAVTDQALRSGQIDLDLEPGRYRPAGVKLQSIEAPSGAVTSLLFAAGGRFAGRGLRRTLAATLDLRQLPSQVASSERPVAGGPLIEQGMSATCGLLPAFVVGSVVRDACPAAPAKPSARPLIGETIRLGVSGRRWAAVSAAPVQAAIRQLGGDTRLVTVGDPLAAVRQGRVDAAVVRVDPSLPHPAGWLAPAAQVDALLARELPKLLAGPLTGSASQWSALERRAVDRAVDVPLVLGRGRVVAAPDVVSGSVVLHPVLGPDLAALRLG